MDSGAHTLLQGNQSWGNGAYGISYDEQATDGHAYRDNMLRGNAGGPVEDPAAAATDETGNIY